MGVPEDPDVLDGVGEIGVVRHQIMGALLPVGWGGVSTFYRSVLSLRTVSSRSLMRS
jgi:hypothetical protein